MKLVITGTNASGRSEVAALKNVPDSGRFELWRTSREEPLGFEAPPAPFSLDLPKGVSTFGVSHIPPEAQMAEYLKGVLDGDRFHTTPTIDYVIILEGTLTLQLDDQEIEIHAGDVVVQRQTRHAWTNRTDKPVKLLGVMTRLDE